MSKMSELDLTVKELRNAAESLTAVADGLTALLRNGEEKLAEKVPSSATQSKSTPKPKPVTLEQVRAVLAEKSRSGHTAEVRELLLSHGANKLSEIDPAEYAALLAEAEVLGNG